MILLEPGFEGPFNTGYWDAKSSATGQTRRISGKQASMISMILAGYEFKDGFHPMEAFTAESLEAGRADARVVNADAGTEVAEGASAA